MTNMIKVHHKNKLYCFLKEGYNDLNKLLSENITKEFTLALIIDSVCPVWKSFNIDLTFKGGVHAK